MKLIVDDPSSSNSERREMHVFDAQTGRKLRHCDEGFGTPGTKEYALVKGKTYTFKIKHVGTNRSDDDGPDYDWQCLINGSADAGLREDLHNTGPFIVEDPGDLLTQLYNGSDVNAAAGKEGKIIVPKIEFVHAEGEDEGEPMEQLPVFTPQHGIGMGPPIYDIPGHDLSFALSPANPAGLRSVTVTHLSSTYTLTETVQDSLTFANGTASLTLSGALLDDPNVQERISASITVLSLGITNAVYPCVETADDSSAFVNDLHGLILAKNSLTGTAQLQISSMSFMNNATLIETSVGTGVFTNGHLTVSVLQLSGQPHLMVSDKEAITNAIFSVWETAPQSNIFRNYNEPIPTNLSADDLAVPDFAPWQLKITGVTDPDLVSQVTVSTSVDNTTDSAIEITFTSDGDSLISDQKFILTPNRSLEASVPSEYTPLKIDDTAVRWQDMEAVDVTAQVTWAAPVTRSAPPTSTAEAKAKPGAVVLQSLDWWAKMGHWTRPDSRFADRFKKMGYTVTKDYKASVSKTLNEYILGKQIWYSLSHGMTEFGSPDTEFIGLQFQDGDITANMLPQNLNYQLVMVDGCCSASTGENSQSAAIENPNVSSTVTEFANMFGTDVAYAGWAWTMDAGWAQYFMGGLSQNLLYEKSTGRGRTVAEAHAKLLSDNVNAKPSEKLVLSLMKLYGSINNVLDLRENK